MERGRHDAPGGLVGAPSKRQRAEPPASLVLLAADDDASRYVVPRATALGESELLAEMLRTQL
eukprot:SAG31_NODE_14030_length_830_cov_11.875513_1_plen_63_part_00